MANYDVRLDWQAGRMETAPCPMCACNGPHPLGVNVHSPASPASGADYFRCRGCAGLFASPFAYPDYAEDYGFPDYLRYYAEAGAGVASMIEPLQRAFRRGMSPMIDVGSGVPFAADFARRVLKMDARSIDPSTYARLGGEWLGVPVEGALLGGGSSADGKAFDIVYSSEVVEHVEDPATFLEILARHVAPNGVLVVTTPNAEFVSPERAPLENLGLVWPGIHHALFTPSGLKTAIETAGLTHVEVVTERERLVAYGSDTPLSLNPPGGGMADAYLAEAVGQTTALPLVLGHRFRLFRAAVGEGRSQDALEQLAKLRVVVLDAAGADITHSHAIADDAENKNAEAFHKTWPYFAPLMPYLLGSLALAEGARDVTAASRHFSEQVRICERFHGGDPLWRAEIAHLWAPSVFSHGVSRLMQRDAALALESFDILLNGRAPAGSLAALGRRDAGLLVQAKIQRGSALLMAGQKDAAAAALREARCEADPAHHGVIDGLLARCDA